MVRIRKKKKEDKRIQESDIKVESSRKMIRQKQKERKVGKSVKKEREKGDILIVK